MSESAVKLSCHINETVNILEEGLRLVGPGALLVA